MPGMAGTGPSSAGGQVPMEQGLLGAPSPIPTECLLLKNLFDPTTETEEDWHLDIAEDVKEECGKHGPVDHIFVDKDSRVRSIAVPPHGRRQVSVRMSLHPSADASMTCLAR